MSHGRRDLFIDSEISSRLPSSAREKTTAALERVILNRQPSHRMPKSKGATKPQTHYKVVMVGAPGVGKTTLARAWAGLPLPHLHWSTSGMKVYHMPLAEETDITFEVHDLSGYLTEEEAADSLDGADAVVLVYDRRRLGETLGDLTQKWIPLAKELAGIMAAYILVANKAYTDQYVSLISMLHGREKACFKSLPEFKRRTMSFGDLATIRKYADLTRMDIYITMRTTVFNKWQTGAYAVRVGPIVLPRRRRERRCGRCSFFLYLLLALAFGFLLLICARWFTQVRFELFRFY